MNKKIVITSIFKPTEAIAKFSVMQDYQLIVVGDKKTPSDWSYPNVTYLSPIEQEQVGNFLYKILPYNHYCRKMIGYLTAIKNQADFIIDTDDDNIPKENFNFPNFNGTFDTIIKDQSFINIYQLYTEQHIWPRGLPLRLIKTKFLFENIIQKENIKVGIWQGLADEDTDVDAIYRLTSDQWCNFKDREPIVLSSGTISPFNSQNTMFTKDLFPLLYLPAFVTFRFTDILRGLIAQPIMWAHGYHLGFIPATVTQKRNPHDYTKDFIDEVPMYLYTDKVMDIAIKVATSNKSITDNLLSVYEALEKENIVTKREIALLEAWLKDLQTI